MHSLLSKYQDQLLDYFLEFVQIDTQADPFSTTVPSTLKQLDLSKRLKEILEAIALEDIVLTEAGYVLATIPSNVDHDVPVLCFCSHVDTAPDCSGTNVKPLVHSDYNGSPIVLPDDPEQVISIENHPILEQHLGEDIITASGLTLLGADDKSGVAIITQLAQILKENPEIPHGKIRIFFTTDEEVGRGVDHLDMDQLAADFGYTLDGGRKGSFENETFSADYAKLTIEGVSIHPGMAKGIMENSMKIGADIINALPKEELSPETTEGRQGFIHPYQIKGELETTTIEFLLRAFDDEALAQHQEILTATIEKVMKNYPESKYTLDVKAQYRNMGKVLEKHPEASAFALEAIRRAGMEPIVEPIRGGTDGSRLSYMGLPCPNIFTGMHGIHSRQEWISLQDMMRSLHTLLELVQIWEKESR